MIALTLQEVAAAVSGTLLQDDAATTVISGGVEFDSRKIGPGDLFIAIAGARVDGHDFLADVAAKGAAAALVAREIPDAPLPTILVPAYQRDSNSYATAHDVDGSVSAMLHALGNLARRVVLQLKDQGLKVIGLTGSAGKTSTKDMLATICSAQGPTVAPAGSFNNEIGHPYTALQATEDTEFLVAEMSARSIGDVALLAHISPPDVGLELNVGTAHLGEFGSREVIAQAKGELVEALATEGIAVLNADDDLVWAMAARTVGKVWAYTTAPEIPAAVASQAEVVLQARDIRFDENACAHFDAVLHAAGQQTVLPVQLRVVGAHQVSNGLAAVLAAMAAGVDFAYAIASLQCHEVRSAHRMEVHQRGGFSIIDDAYNANPESMRAGLAAAARLADGSHPLVAVLGPMSEVGEDAYNSHAAIGAALGEYGVTQLVVLAQHADAQGYIAGAEQAGIAVVPVEDAAAAGTYVAENAPAGAVVYLKASNSYRLWEAMDQIPK